MIQIQPMLLLVRRIWKTVNTEADLTANGEQYPSVSIVQHVWGGWHLDLQ